MTDAAYTYALHLANTLRDKHFPDNPWTPADDTLGLLMQIDNMTSALVPSEPHIYDRIERRLDRLYTKLVTEPTQRQEAALAAYKADMDVANRLNALVKADPALSKVISGELSRTMADIILTQADPGAVMRYLYLGAGKGKIAALDTLPPEDLKREIDTISRRIATVKGVMSRALNNVHEIPKSRPGKQGTEDK